jgi:hypothetical protein
VSQSCIECHKSAGGHCYQHPVAGPEVAINDSTAKIAPPQTNERYTITIQSPLIRPGLTIQTSVSKRYLAQTVRDMLNVVREINRS